MSFPTHRLRRLRRNEALRGLVRETRLTTSGLIHPMFVCPGTKVRQEVGSMPGVYQQSVDQIVEECREVESLGIPGVCPNRRTHAGPVLSAARVWYSGRLKRFAKRN